MQSCPCFLCRWSLTTTHPGRPDHAHLRFSCKDGCSWACRSLTTTHPVCPDHAFPMVVVQGWSLLTPPRSAQAGPVGGQDTGTHPHPLPHPSLHNKLAGFIQRLSVITLKSQKNKTHLRSTPVLILRRSAHFPLLATRQDIITILWPPPI